MLLSITISIGLLGCLKDQDAPPFKWDPEIYIADSRSMSVVRQDDIGMTVQIFCKNTKFDNLVCLDKSEPKKALQAAYDLINACEKWKSNQAMIVSQKASDEILYQLHLLSE